nr:MAG TPA: hypothetical protein [Bacteriophage sp.]
MRPTPKEHRKRRGDVKRLVGYGVRVIYSNPCLYLPRNFGGQYG